jgi:Ca2+/H+ antiporter
MNFFSVEAMAVGMLLIPLLMLCSISQSAGQHAKQKMHVGVHYF